MPIKPENKKRYPANWKQIREQILIRANHCCEACKAPNHTRIARGGGEDKGTYMNEDCYVFCDQTGKLLGQIPAANYEVLRMTDIVLTIAHLDHQPENCEPANLKALCQKCHLNYDADLHHANSRKTRMERKAIGDLFEGDYLARTEAA